MLLLSHSYHIWRSLYPTIVRFKLSKERLTGTKCIVFLSYYSTIQTLEVRNHTHENISLSTYHSTIQTRIASGVRGLTPYFLSYRSTIQTLQLVRHSGHRQPFYPIIVRFKHV